MSFFDWQDILEVLVRDRARVENELGIREERRLNNEQENDNEDDNDDDDDDNDDRDNILEID